MQNNLFLVGSVSPSYPSDWPWQGTLFLPLLRQLGARGQGVAAGTTSTNSQGGDRASIFLVLPRSSPDCSPCPDWDLSQLNSTNSLVWASREHCPTLLQCSVLQCSAVHCTALQCTALHCTALHCAALHCSRGG